MYVCVNIYASMYVFLHVHLCVCVWLKSASPVYEYLSVCVCMISRTFSLLLLLLAVFALLVVRFPAKEYHRMQQKNFAVTL